jgi:sugar/nucleoside kinase (ribokinase family)
MIAVTGEALIDLVIDSEGHLGAQPGGGPLNTARTIGRLGLGPSFVGRLSQDGLGRMLRARLDQDGVTLAVPQLTDTPTTLVVADVAYLSPDVPAGAAAADLLDQGPALILVTDGPRTAQGYLPRQEVAIDVPAVKVVDAIGAGDAFGGRSWPGGHATSSPSPIFTSPARSAKRSRRPSRSPP